MTESYSESLSDPPINTDVITTNNNIVIPEIPIDIVSEEEMALLEAAILTARASLSAAPPAIRSSSTLSFRSNVRSIQSITALSKRRLSSGCSEPDIEDSSGLNSSQKKTRMADSLLHRFRKKGLSVTDITGTEWCEKQMEFILLVGKRKVSKAMKTGIARHAKLEEEVVKRVKVRVESTEDRWALKLLNFITGVNQLLFEGLTRELPLVGFAEGVWMVGVIDEIRMPVTETIRKPLLVDTKTRVKDTLPAEPQRRNGRLQLMCYKYMLDGLVADKFPTNKFFDFFSLNPHHILSEEIKEMTVYSGFPAETLNDVVRYYENTCSMMPPTHDRLLLRYELQRDHSVLGEDEFAYDSVWVKNQIQGCLEFWKGEREARYTPEEERWKCQFCQYSSVCPANNSNSDTPLS